MILSLVCGALMFNAIPHIVKGICGETHMSPFAQKSSACVNVIWGWINLIIGAAIAFSLDYQSWGTGMWICFSAGGIGISVWLSLFWSNPDAHLPWHSDDKN